MVRTWLARIPLSPTITSAPPPETGGNTGGAEWCCLTAGTPASRAETEPRQRLHRSVSEHNTTPYILHTHATEGGASRHYETLLT